MIHNPITELEQLTLTGASKTFLKETAKWTKFLAILGFVFICFMLVLAIFTTTIYEYAVIIKPDLPRGLGLVMMITYLLLAFIYFFPVYYLLKFSNQLKKHCLQKMMRF